MSALDLDIKIGKITSAMMIRNRQIGVDLIADLRNQMTLKEVASMMLVSIDRLLWLDAESVLWTIENVIPGDVLHEIQTIISFPAYKYLIVKGYIPGKDMSVDGNGKLLVKAKTKTLT